jgi:hypothetical protein
MVTKSPNPDWIQSRDDSSFKCMMGYCKETATRFYASSYGLRCFCEKCGPFIEFSALLNPLTQRQFEEALTNQVMAS